jgi:DNA-binding MarR family transcriptional regulator
MVSFKKAEGVELDALRSLMAAVEPFREIRPTMPLQYVIAFLLVAMDEGLSVSDYAQRAGVSLSVMSRHLLDIGERNRHMEEGFGLITSRQSPLELRRNEIYLTPKGKALLHKIVRQLKK